jgi:release factor glutamine methyltransferase
MTTPNKLPLLIARNSQKLEEAGIDQGLAEVEIILCNILNVERLELYLNGDKLINDDHLKKLDEIVAKRTTRYPLQFILEEAWFYGRSFFVSPAVMVPTPETEILCETAMGFIRSKDLSKPRILDVGVGSGVISVTLVNELSECSIVSLDISEKAIAVAKKNADNLGGKEKIEFRQSDFFSALNPDEKFDLILSNPPYISHEEYKDLPPEVLADPKISLVADNDGLGAIESLVKEAPNFLNKDGRLMFEIGYNQAERVSNLTENDPRYQSIVQIKDLNDIDRVVILACD